MVTPEERITRLEAAQEANNQQLALVLSRLDQVLNLIEVVRQEDREANEVARREAREMNEAARQEAREANESARREAREMVDAARRDARNLFIAGFTIGAALFTGFGVGTMTLLFRVLERLPA